MIVEKLYKLDGPDTIAGVGARLEVDTLDDEGLENNDLAIIQDDGAPKVMNKILIYLYQS